jgi:hypothetical protein
VSPSDGEVRVFPLLLLEEAVEGDSDSEREESGLEVLRVLVLLLLLVVVTAGVVVAAGAT